MEMHMKQAGGTPEAGRRRLIQGAAAAAVTALAFSAGAAQPQAAASKPRIGIIGSGNVGSNIGRVWARAGYQVMFASLDLEGDRKLAASVGANARAGTPREAAAFGDVLLFAVPYGALPALGRDLGSALRGKVVIDACNPFEARDGGIAKETRAQGAGAVSARLLPGARIVRAFNAVGAARMGAVHETPGKVGMPIAGDDREAITIASQLIRDIGFEPVLVGGLAMGKYLMPGTPLAGEHAPQEIRKIAATLTP
jgi:8-hydroxy-5-deazaflavin:NADPH oxidoreductase